MYISIIYISQRLNVAKYLQSVLQKVNENKKQNHNRWERTKTFHKPRYII